MTKFEVIIPTKNRPEDLTRLLDSIDQQTELPVCVIIVDQSDDFCEIHKTHQFKIKHLFNNKLTGLTAAKNYGIGYTSSEIIYFFDDDIILYPDFFEKINTYFSEHKDIAGICGRQINSKSSRFKLAMFNLFHKGCFKDIRKKCNSGYTTETLKVTNVLPGGITAYRRLVFDEFIFDENLIKYCLGEDMDFSYRVSSKYKLAFATTAHAIHNHSTIGRYNPYESFACKVAGYAYFFKKNVPQKWTNSLSYYWVETGVLFDAIQYMFTKKDTASIRGFIHGLRMVKDNFKNVPFIAQTMCANEPK